MKSKSYRIIVFVLVCLGLAAPASASWMGSFVLDHGATSHLGHSEKARVTFDFKVTNPDGARFVVDVLYEGVVVPGSYWGGSPTYADGTVGTHSNYITFTSGTITIDQYRIRMLDAVSGLTLLTMCLPVEYFFGPNAVNDIQLNYTSPSWILNGEFLTIDFSYRTDEPGGVRISARPYTGGALTPGYGASGVQLSPVGIGTASQFFTFNTVTADVDEIRFQMFNADYSVKLMEFYVPVDLHWGPNGISNISINWASPNYLAWDQPVTVEFDYATSEAAGCRIWARGLDTDQGPILGMFYDPSPVLTTTGHTVRNFHMSSSAGQGEVGFVHMQMTDADNTEELVMVTFPVSFPFGPNAVQNVVFSPASPAVLDAGERVETAFDYVTNETEGMRIYNIPYQYEAVAPYAVGASPLYMGSGSGDSHFSVLPDGYFVNGLLMSMKTAAATGDLGGYMIPCEYTFGGTGGVTPVLDLPPAGNVVLGQNYPNPFNPMTSIPVDLSTAGRVVLKVYDLRGHLVDNVADEIMPAGRNQIVFDGSDLASGTYFYMIETDHGRQTRRMILVK